MTAFDMDYLINPHVRAGQENLAHLLDQCGISYGTYLWDPRYKGLDDYIWGCCAAQSEREEAERIRLFFALFYGNKMNCRKLLDTEYISWYIS